MRDSKTIEKSQTEGELNKKLNQKVVEIRYEPSEELVPALLSSSQTVFYIVQDRKFKVVTPQLCKLMKLSRKELLTKNPLSIVHPNDRDMVRENAVKMLKGERSDPYEFRFLDNDGKTKYAREVVTSIIYKGKLATLGNWIDLTERRQVEEELRMSEEKYRHLFDNLNDAAFLADNQTGIIIETNRQGAALLGRSRSEIIGMHQSQLHPLDKAEEYRLRFNTHISKGHDADYDGEVIRKDGKIVPVAISASSLIIHGQSLLLGLFHDITKRKHTEETLQEIGRFNTSLLSNAPNPITVIGPDTSIRYVSPSFEKLTGFAGAEVIGLKPPYPWWPEESREEFESLLMKDMGKGSNLIEKELRKKNGERFWVEFNVVSVNHNGTLGYLLLNWVDITERKEAEKALRQERDKAQKYLDIAGVIIAAINKKGVVTLMNKKGCEVLGYEEEEVTGKNWFDNFIPTRIKEEMKQVFKALMAGEVEAAKYFENPVITKNGQERIIAWHNSVLKDEAGSFIGTLSSGEDITERKRAETALRESEEKFSKAFLSSPNSISISTLKDGIFLEVNDSFLRSNGFTREDVIGRSAKDVTLWAKADDRDRMILLLKEQGRVSNEEFQFIVKSGEIRTVLFSADIINIGGEPCIISVSNDITERRHAEKALTESEEKFSVAFRSSPEMIAVSNMKKGIYIEVNDSYTRTTGYSREELIGHPVGEINMFADQEDADKMARLMQEQGKMRNKEYKFRMKSGEIRNWLCSAEVITIGGDPCSIAVATDITERKIMEDELRKHRDHLEELVKKRTTELESLNTQLARELTERERIEGELRIAIKNADAANMAKSEFLARMSHEIRTPIHGVMGTLDLLRDTELGQEQRQYVNMSKASAETLLNVINDVLDFSKIEAGKVELEKKYFNLRVMLEETLETMAVSAHKKGLEVMLQISRGVPAALTGDAGRIRQVLVNLLGNAIKFTEKGEVVLRVDIESENEKDIELHFSVRDTGIGIPKDKQELLFHPFEQVDGSMNRKYGGSGLGLSICKQLLDMMSGRIWFTSWPGEGSIFHFTTKCGKQAVVDGVDSVSGIISNLRGMPLLLVDDNASCRSILKDLLSEWGLQITEADNGRSALKELENTKGTSRQFRIILIDKTMPTVNGFTAAEQILGNSTIKPGIVMMLPSDSISEDFARCQKLGMSYYVIKPVKKSELLNTILAASGQARVAPEPGNRAASANTSIDAPHLRILVAEDNTTSQLIAKKTLEKAGHTVQIAVTGLEAIHMLKEGTFDMVLMDVEMPEMNGLEATRLIRKAEQDSGQHIPVLAMTAYAMKEDRQRCLEAGMDAYLSKPVNLDELHKIIRDFSSVKDTRPAIVDIEAALKFVGGDRDILQEVVHVFLDEDYPEQVKRLKDGIGQHDAQAVKASAHSIKGAVRSLGGTAPGSIALRLEEMGRNNDLAKAEAAAQELELEVKLFADFYAKYNWQRG